MDKFLLFVGVTVLVLASQPWATALPTTRAERSSPPKTSQERAAKMQKEREESIKARDAGIQLEDEGYHKILRETPEERTEREVKETLDEILDDYGVTVEGLTTPTNANERLASEHYEALKRQLYSRLADEKKPPRREPTTFEEGIIPWEVYTNIGKMAKVMPNGVSINLINTVMRSSRAQLEGAGILSKTKA